MKRLISTISVSLLPTMALAQAVLPPSVLTLMGKIYNSILNPIIALLFGLAFAYFMWGVVKYVLHGDEEKSREEGRSAILWGIIGMFIMFGVFGIIKLIIGTIGADPDVLRGV
jgi:hypothetical protein